MVRAVYQIGWESQEGNEDLQICCGITHFFTHCQSIINGFKSGRREGIEMNPHNGIPFFAYQKNRLVFDTLDSIYGTLPLVHEFLAWFYGKDAFFCHAATLSEWGALSTFSNCPIGSKDD
jgi:hypothetical protein